ncbi:MAG: hypothetical protein AAF515_00145 [Pseudomonadota bacterium]
MGDRTDAGKGHNAARWQGRIELTDEPDDPFLPRQRGLDLSVPLNVDGSRLREALGFSDPVDEATALVNTLASEMGRSAVGGASPSIRVAASG